MEHSHIRTTRSADPNKVDEYVELNFSNVEHENIFPTPFWSMEVECDNEEILNECYDLRSKYPNGVVKSNEGGWQSSVYDLQTIRYGITPKIKNLAENILEFSEELVMDLYDDRIKQSSLIENGIGWWININNGFTYNVHHTHPGCTMIAIYYAKVPKLIQNEDTNEGQFVVLRQDAMCYSHLFANIQSMCDLHLIPKERHLYIMPSVLAHYVKPHTSDEDRVSIAFNFG